MKTKLALVAFAFSVLLLTRLDFVINNVLYGFGLVFSKEWYNEYMILYSLAYQLVIFVLYAYTKNAKLFVFFEVFVLTCTQDLVYFGLWELGFPSGNWDWMLFNQVLGFWNTTSQVLLSTSGLTLISFIFRVEKLGARLSMFSGGQTPKRNVPSFLARPFGKGGLTMNKATKNWKRIGLCRMARKNWIVRSGI